MPYRRNKIKNEFTSLLFYISTVALGGCSKTANTLGMKKSASIQQYADNTVGHRPIPIQTALEGYAEKELSKIMRIEERLLEDRLKRWKHLHDRGVGKNELQLFRAQQQKMLDLLHKAKEYALNWLPKQEQQRILEGLSETLTTINEYMDKHRQHDCLQEPQQRRISLVFDNQAAHSTDYVEKELSNVIQIQVQAFEDVLEEWKVCIKNKLSDNNLQVFKEDQQKMLDILRMEEFRLLSYLTQEEEQRILRKLSADLGNRKQYVEKHKQEDCLRLMMQPELYALDVTVYDDGTVSFPMLSPQQSTMSSSPPILSPQPLHQESFSQHSQSSSSACSAFNSPQMSRQKNRSNSLFSSPQQYNYYIGTQPYPLEYSQNSSSAFSIWDSSMQQYIPLPQALLQHAQDNSSSSLLADTQGNLPQQQAPLEILIGTETTRVTAAPTNEEVANAITEGMERIASERDLEYIGKEREDELIEIVEQIASRP